MFFSSIYQSLKWEYVWTCHIVSHDYKLYTYWCVTHMYKIAITVIMNAYIYIHTVYVYFLYTWFLGTWYYTSYCTPHRWKCSRGQGSSSSEAAGDWELTMEVCPHDGSICQYFPVMVIDLLVLNAGNFREWSIITSNNHPIPSITSKLSMR